MSTDYITTCSSPNNLEDLQEHLQDLSHDELALNIIQKFAKNLGKTSNRQRVFNTQGAIIRKPITYQDVLDLKLITPDEDSFILLQGDVVSTNTAYFLGERITNMNFVVASSTCDLIPERRKYATLLRIQPIRTNDPDVRQILGELLAFKSTQRMYLPPLPNDLPDVIANALLFDGIVQVRLDDLLVATRLASLSLVGWRIFGSLIRTIMARAGSSEAKIRSSI